MSVIKFCKIFDKVTKQKIPYGEFSNFFVAPFEFKGVKYKTSEHFYQSNKFLNEKDKFDVINAATPREAANIGRDKNRPLREDWNNIKDDIMRLAIGLKFKDNEALKEILLSTGDSEIIEDSPDNYWGCGRDGTGKNMLGKILIEYRDCLYSEMVIGNGG
jgi:hypothetical protein